MRLPPKRALPTVLLKWSHSALKDSGAKVAVQDSPLEQMLVFVFVNSLLIKPKTSRFAIFCTLQHLSKALGTTTLKFYIKNA